MGSQMISGPNGVTVLVVDDDPVTLKVVSALLQKCCYKKVVTSTNGKDALQLLKDDASFDLVLSDVCMPDMDGFRLLELIGLELDVPVIMMSSNGETSTVLRGVAHGAVDFLIKPVRLEELRNLWQHVWRKRKSLETSKDEGESDGQEASANDQEDEKMGVVNGNQQQPEASKKRNIEEIASHRSNDPDNPGGMIQSSSGVLDQSMVDEDSSASKKARLVWSVEMHQRFVAAVNQLGIDKSVPKKILDMMDVEGLTRENVASHLQKYRAYLKRVQMDSEHRSQPGSSRKTGGGGEGGLMHGLGGFFPDMNFNDGGFLPSNLPLGSEDLFGPLGAGLGGGVGGAGEHNQGFIKSKSSPLNAAPSLPLPTPCPPQLNLPPHRGQSSKNLPDPSNLPTSSSFVGAPGSSGLGLGGMMGIPPPPPPPLPPLGMPPLPMGMMPPMPPPPSFLNAMQGGMMGMPPPPFPPFPTFPTSGPPGGLPPPGMMFPNMGGSKSGSGSGPGSGSGVGAGAGVGGGGGGGLMNPNSMGVMPPFPPNRMAMMGGGPMNMSMGPMGMNMSMNMSMGMPPMPMGMMPPPSMHLAMQQQMQQHQQQQHLQQQQQHQMQQKQQQRMQQEASNRAMEAAAEESLHSDLAAAFNELYNNDEGLGDLLLINNDPPSLRPFEPSSASLALDQTEGGGMGLSHEGGGMLSSQDLLDDDQLVNCLLKP